MLDREAPGAFIRSVNVGVLRPNPAKGGGTGFGKRPAAGPVLVRAPGTQKGESGLEGDAVGDAANHGGADQAVYAFAREDLDRWEAELGRVLPDGAFGENLTTVGVDPNAALIGERWLVGEELELQVTAPRLPCVTFAAQMGEPGWGRRFTEDARPGAYFRVLRPGPVGAGDRVVIAHRPAHHVSISLAMAALSLKPYLVSELLAAGEDLSEEMRGYIHSKLK